jgi:hypothetical protein
MYIYIFHLPPNFSPLPSHRSKTHPPPIPPPYLIHHAPSSGFPTSPKIGSSTTCDLHDLTLLYLLFPASETWIWHFGLTRSRIGGLGEGRLIPVLKRGGLDPERGASDGVNYSGVSAVLGRVICG